MESALKRKLALGFGALLIIVVAISGVAFQNGQQFINGKGRVIHTLEVLNEIENASVSITNIELMQRGFIITGDDLYLEAYPQALDDLNDELSYLEQLTADNPVQKQRLASLNTLIPARFKLLQRTIDLRRDSGFDAARQAIILGDGQAISNEIRSLLSEMSAEENGLLVNRTEESEQIARATVGPLVLLVVICVAILFIVYWFIYREMNARAEAQKVLRLSEEKWRSLVENAPDIVTSFTPDGTILFVNRRSTTEDTERFIGKNIFDFVTPDQREILNQAIQEVLETKVTVSYEVTSREGQSHYISRISPVMLDGKIVNLINNSTDITERVKAEHNLRYFASLTQNVSDAIMSADRDVFTIRSWNKAAEKLYGWTAEEAIGKQLKEIVKTEYVHETPEAALETFITTGEWHGEIIQTDKTGRKMNILSSVNMLYDHTGKGISTIAVNRDITERKKSEAEIAYQANLLANVNDAIIATDDQHNITYWNLAAEEIYGWKTGEILAKPLAQVFGAESHDLQIQEILNRSKVGGSYTTELSQKRKDGTVVYIEATSIVLRDEAGQLTGFIWVNRDITERKEIEAQLIESEERSRTTFDMAAVGIAQMGPDGAWLQVNQKVCEIVGYSSEELLKLNFQDLTYPDDLDADLAYAYQMRDGKIENYSIEKRYIRKDRSLVWCNLTVSVVRKPTGEAKYYISVIEDISERKQAEAEIRQLNDDLEQRAIELAATNKELEAFSYSVSHDLRAPLRSIDGFSQALLEDYIDILDSTGQNYLQRILGATQRMGQLIDDLLDLARITRAEIKLEPVNLTQLAERIVAELRQANPNRQVTFTVPDGLIVSGDSRMVRIALENLLANAWKFTSKHEQAHIELGVMESETDQPIYFVRDDGEGFDMAYANKLFGVFQRLHAMTEFAGTGVGLATVQRIIHRHGGRIWADATIGKGATFYFTF